MNHIVGGAWISPEAALRPQSPAPERDGQGGRTSYYCDIQRGSGYLPTPGVSLNARDAAQLGCNEDGSVQVLLDGAVYNDALLRRRLEGSGHRFGGATPAEHVAHLYEDEGLDCFKLLEGPFAIAIWDAPRRRLVLARDALGQRPLHYRNDGRRLAFGGRLRDLLQAGVGQPEVDPGALDEYLTYGYVPHAHTLLRGYCKLPPGFVAIYRDGDLTFRRYWEPDFSRESREPPVAVAEQLRQTLKAAVAEQVADACPVGVWLTGDLETTIVAALAHEATGNETAGYYLSDPGGATGAAENLRGALKSLGVALEELECDIKPVDLPAALVEQLDEPLADVNLSRALCVARQAPATMLLTGAGANELFAGLPRYREILSLRDVLPRWARWLIQRPSLDEALEGGASQQRPLSKDKRRAYFAKVSLFDETARSDLYTESLVQQLVADPVDFMVAGFSHIRGRDPVATVGAVDLLTCLPCSTLPGLKDMFDNRAEPRAPYLDRRVVELAIQAPGGWNAPRRGVGKLLLRRSVSPGRPRKPAFPPAAGHAGRPLAARRFARSGQRNSARSRNLGPRLLSRKRTDQPLRLAARRRRPQPRVVGVAHAGVVAAPLGRRDQSVIESESLRRDRFARFRAPGATELGVWALATVSSRYENRG